MDLEKLNLEAVRKSLEPHVSQQILDMAKDEREKALLLDLKENENTNRFLVERAVLNWNSMVDLHVRLDDLLEKTIKPMQTLARATRWIIGSAASIAAVWAFVQAFFKGGHKP